MESKVPGRAILEVEAKRFLYRAEGQLFPRYFMLFEQAGFKALLTRSEPAVHQPASFQLSTIVITFRPATFNASRRTEPALGK
jgi:hypothetical protein